MYTFLLRICILSGIAGWLGMHVYSFSSYCQTIFQRGLATSTWPPAVQGSTKSTQTFGIFHLFHFNHSNATSLVLWAAQYSIEWMYSHVVCHPPADGHFTCFPFFCNDEYCCHKQPCVFLFRHKIEPFFREAPRSWIIGSNDIGIIKNFGKFWLAN